MLVREVDVTQCSQGSAIMQLLGSPSRRVFPTCQPFSWYCASVSETGYPGDMETLMGHIENPERKRNSKGISLSCDSFCRTWITDQSLACPRGRCYQGCLVPKAPCRSWVGSRESPHMPREIDVYPKSGSLRNLKHHTEAMAVMRR
jgi:hypothetical protein